jgi:pimeloyl-ACP methyl ester carboxylesterase
MIIIIVGSVSGSLAVLFGAGLLYRTLRQQQQARALAIQSPNKIEEGRFVQIGACAQWIRIRGEDRDNPVLLVLHGGPGIAFSAFTSRFRSWEHDFTVVQWDQPGAGKTASRNGKAGSDTLSIEGMAQDGIQVTEWVLKHLKARKLILFGASWGTILGTLMVKRRPDLFWAYVGAGQFVDGKQGEALGYALALERAQKLGDSQTVKALESIGPPPYADQKTFMVGRRAMGKVGVETFPRLGDLLSATLLSPGYSLKDGYAWFRGVQSSAARLLEAIMAYDARQLGTTFETPLFFFQGALDLYTPARAVSEYVATLQAPQKELLLWEQEGHLTFLTNPELVRKELVARVRPLAMGGAPHSPLNARSGVRYYTK